VKARTTLFFGAIWLAAASYSQPLPEVGMVASSGPSEIAMTRPTVEARTPVSGSVSFSELIHKVPDKAKREASRARKELEKGNLVSCVAHFKAALEIDPQYLDARRELALAYVRSDEPEQVIAAYEEVLKVDPRSGIAYSFIAAAHAKLLHFPEAESAARRGLAIDPANERSRYVLGAALALQEKNDGDAVRLLKQASEAFPGARLLAARVLARRGELVEARAQLEAYLPVASPSMRDLVADWIARLD
jgi:tetratricopeptide (TPR) repeat protein